MADTYDLKWKRKTCACSFAGEQREYNDGVFLYNFTPQIFTYLASIHDALAAPNCANDGDMVLDENFGDWHCAKSLDYFGDGENCCQQFSFGRVCPDEYDYMNEYNLLNYSPPDVLLAAGAGFTPNCNAGNNDHQQCCDQYLGCVDGVCESGYVDIGYPPDFPERPTECDFSEAEDGGPCSATTVNDPHVRTFFNKKYDM